MYYSPFFQEKAKRDKLQEQRNKDKRFYEQQIELLKEVF